MPNAGFAINAGNGEIPTAADTDTTSAIDNSGATIPGQRVITLDYPGYQHLCEVSILRDDGSRDVKWYANSDSGFCVTKFHELAGKHESQWGFACTLDAGPSNLESLSPRQRRAVDLIVKETLENSRSDTMPWLLVGTRALATGNPVAATAASTKPESLDADAVITAASNNQQGSIQLSNNDDGQDVSEARYLALQLFMASKSSEQMSFRDELLLFKQTDDNIRLLAREPDLGSRIQLDKDGYRLSSAMIRELTPQGELSVGTLVLSPEDNVTGVPRCYGLQNFRASSDAIDTVGDHSLTCDLQKSGS